MTPEDEERPPAHTPTLKRLPLSLHFLLQLYAPLLVASQRVTKPDTVKVVVDRAEAELNSLDGDEEVDDPVVAFTRCRVLLLRELLLGRL